MSRHRITILLSAALAGVAWASACGDGATEPPPPDPPRPTTVTVSPATAELTSLGATRQLTVEVRAQNGQPMAGAAVSWSSSNAAVATVDAQRLVTAAGNGTATITATAGSASGSATVAVRQEVSTVAVSPAADTLVAGDTLRLAAVARDANGHAVTGVNEFSWASSDTAVAVVDEAGLATGVGTGEVEITATSSGVTGRAELVVVPPAPTTVTVTPDTVVFTALGDTMRLTAEVRDQLGRAFEAEAVVWASGDTLVATVDSAGLVTAVENGIATITASAGEASGSALAKVMQSAGSVIVSPPADTIAPGDTVRLVAEAFDQHSHPAAGAEFSWSSSDGAVATVDGSGLVLGVGEGTATITATSGSAQGTSAITVVNPDRAALVALHEATAGRNWTHRDNWLTQAPLKDWYGVEVNGEGRVISLELPENGLVGHLPPELGDLAELEGLELDGNVLTGAIPPEFGSLPNLQRLNVVGNRLEGPIPPELGNLAKLESLELGGNGLTGAIPPELGNLTSLTELDLSGNNLSGPIPPELGNLANLWVLDLADNKSLSGPIPPELGNPANLTWLYLHYNRLSGPIPPELGNLSGLEDLFLDHNNLWGPIPRSLLDLTKLNRFYFNDNAGLCAPGTTDFADWVEGIEGREGPFCNASDRAVLAALFEAAGGSGWTNARGWLGDPATLAGWHGVRANSLGRVTALDLSRNGLAGRLPGSLGELAHMTELRIADNAGLSLRLPLSLSGLSLRVLHYTGTELCVPVERSFRDWLSQVPSHEGTGAECAPGTLSGTVNHGWGGWTDPHTNGFGDGASYRPGSSSAGESGVGTAAPAVTTPDGYVIGAVVEVVDGPDAGRRTTTDDSGRYVLEALQQGEFTIRALAEGFASVGGVVDLASDRVLDLAISQPPTPQPTSPFPDTDPAWLQALSSDYPYAHQVANVRVFSDISPTFSREHAEHLKRVSDFFNALYVKNRGDWIDDYYTTSEEVFLKLPGATIDPYTRNTPAYYLDYPRWFNLLAPFPEPDFGTQLHEIGHDFPFAVWPQAWDASLWFVEGTAMYWEGGVFTDDGSLRVSTPLNKRYCANGFPDPGSRLIPLAELLRLGEAFYPDPRPTYPQSCMLFTYLEKRAPGVLFALIYRINSGQIVSNDQLITALLDLTGKSISELEEAYQSYAWSMR